MKLALENSATIDFSKPIDKEELRQEIKIFDLAKTNRTLLEHETKEYKEEKRREWEAFKSSDEYHKDMLAMQEDLKKELYVEELSRGRDDERRWDAYIQGSEFKKLSEFEKAYKKRQFEEHMNAHNEVWLTTKRTLETEAKEWESLKHPILLAK